VIIAGMKVSCEKILQEAIMENALTAEHETFLFRVLKISFLPYNNGFQHSLSLLSKSLWL
jgi:hypothetical protein